MKEGVKEMGFWERALNACTCSLIELAELGFKFYSVGVESWDFFFFLQEKVGYGKIHKFFHRYWFLANLRTGAVETAAARLPQQPV